MRYQDMDAWSQAMIDGIANYTGNKEVEARCHAATSGIDAAIDDMIPVVKQHPNTSILSVLLAAGQNMESIRANIKLAISGGQNEPRDAIAGTIWALLTHPEQLALVRDGKAKWIDVFEDMRAGSRRSRCRRAASPNRGAMAASTSSRKTACSSCSARPIATRPALPSRPFRHHPQYPEEHRLRRGSALLRRRVRLPRHGGRRRAAERVRAAERPAAG